MGNSDYRQETINRIEEFTEVCKKNLSSFTFEIEDSFERSRKKSFKRTLVIHGPLDSVKGKIHIICEYGWFNIPKWAFNAKVYRRGEYNGEITYEKELDSHLFEFIKTKLLVDEEMEDINNLDSIILYTMCIYRQLRVRRLVNRTNHVFHSKHTYKEINKALNNLFQNGYIKFDKEIINIVYITNKGKALFKPPFYTRFLFPLRKSQLPKIIGKFAGLSLYKTTYMIDFKELKEVMKNESNSQIK